jgi:hypothetical protein
MARASITNIRPGWKGFASDKLTNELIFKHLQIMAAKSCITLGPRANALKNFFATYVWTK